MYNNSRKKNMNWREAQNGRTFLNMFSVGTNHRWKQHALKKKKKMRNNKYFIFLSHMYYNHTYSTKASVSMFKNTYF